MIKIALSAAAICAVLTGCAGSHGTAASTPTPDVLKPQSPTGTVMPDYTAPPRTTAQTHTTIYGVDQNINGFIFSAERRSDSKQLWRRRLPCTDGGTTLLHGDRVYVGCSSELGGVLMVLSAADGSVERKVTFHLNGVVKLEFAGTNTIVVSGTQDGARTMSWTDLLDATTLRSKMVRNPADVEYLGTVGDRAYLDITSWTPTAASDVSNPPLMPEVIVAESLTLERETRPVGLLPEPKRHTANDQKVAHLVGSKIYLRVGADTYVYDAARLQLPPVRLEQN